MSKELEVLKRLKMYVDCCECDYISNPNEDYEIVKNALEEHEQYKEAEKELGINILTLIRALKEGIYLKYPDGSVSDKKHITFDEGLHYCNSNLGFAIFVNFYLKDYGKTWALTKEELS